MAAKCDNIMTINILAGRCKIFQSAIYKLVLETRFPGQKIGKRWRFHKDVVDRVDKAAL